MSGGRVGRAKPPRGPSAARAHLAPAVGAPPSAIEREVARLLDSYLDSVLAVELEEVPVPLAETPAAPPSFRLFADSAPGALVLPPRKRVAPIRKPASHKRPRPAPASRDDVKRTRTADLPTASTAAAANAAQRNLADESSSEDDPEELARLRSAVVAVAPPSLDAHT